MVLFNDALGKTKALEETTEGKKCKKKKASKVLQGVSSILAVQSHRGEYQHELRMLPHEARGWHSLRLNVHLYASLVF